jgi:glycerophosphoryl diester phosphodiesterase
MRVAHRGFAAVALENSLEAIEGALRHGCDKIEMDVRRSADGQIVLHHDSGKKSGAPLLADALRLIGPTPAGVMLDIKEPGVADAVASLLAEHAPGARVIASGRAPEVLRLKALRPTVLGGRSWPLRNACGIPLLERAVALQHRHALLRQLPRIMTGFDVLVAYHRALSKPAVDAAHQAGYEVYAWTVDDRDAIRRLGSWGVDGIVSDHPDSFDDI